MAVATAVRRGCVAAAIPVERSFERVATLSRFRGEDAPLGELRSVLQVTSADGTKILGAEDLRFFLRAGQHGSGEAGETQISEDQPLVNLLRPLQDGGHLWVLAAVPREWVSTRADGSSCVSLLFGSQQGVVSLMEIEVDMGDAQPASPKLLKALPSNHTRGIGYHASPVSRSEQPKTPPSSGLRGRQSSGSIIF